MKHIKTSKLVEFELYNLNQDMGQQTDLAKKHPEQLDKLKKLLVAKYNEVQAEGPVWKLPSKKK
jgi:ABC-type taurine transport system substrate-binding protein